MHAILNLSMQEKRGRFHELKKKHSGGWLLVLGYIWVTPGQWTLCKVCGYSSLLGVVICRTFSYFTHPLPVLGDCYLEGSHFHFFSLSSSSCFSAIKFRKCPVTYWVVPLHLLQSECPLWAWRYKISMEDFQIHWQNYSLGLIFCIHIKDLSWFYDSSANNSRMMYHLHCTLCWNWKDH
jgi:hypothetical protein